MILADLRKQSIKELEKELAKLEDEWLEFMVDVRTKGVSDNRLGRRLRRDIARIKTIIREKQLGEDVGTVGAKKTKSQKA